MYSANTKTRKSYFIRRNLYLVVLKSPEKVLYITD